MPRPTHLGVHHLALRVADLDASRHFYVDLLGYAVEWEPDPNTVYLTCGNDSLALHARPADGPPASPVSHLDHFGLLVPSPAEVGAWEIYLRAAQIRIDQSTRTHRDGATSCTVLDPDGVALQIIHHPPIVPALRRSLP
jgi:catechol 2,3-dioxygenase-like lactoylglutathione lyase family enzyme